MFGGFPRSRSSKYFGKQRPLNPLLGLQREKLTIKKMDHYSNERPLRKIEGYYRNQSVSELKRKEAFGTGATRYSTGRSVLLGAQNATHAVCCRTVDMCHQCYHCVGRYSLSRGCPRSQRVRLYPDGNSHGPGKSATKNVVKTNDKSYALLRSSSVDKLHLSYKYRVRLVCQNQ